MSLLLAVHLALPAGLAGWSGDDTWVVVTAALAAMACALPGCWLVLRQQSLMGDVLSHTTLPGLVMAFLAVHLLTAAGLIPPENEPAARHLFLFCGALLTGVLSAFMAEWLQQFGQVESSAALGVVLSTLFAAGLLMIRLFADNVHVDPECVLFGTIETVALGEPGVPSATLAVGAICLLNLLLTLLFFKELRMTAFDPGLATALGFPARLIHLGLMAVTSATVVFAFESVGSILVVAMLIVPAAAAHLLTDRLAWLIGLSLGIAVLSAVGGHVSAIVVPPLVFGWFGYADVGAASTAGMTALASGALFLLAWLAAPQHGLISKIVGRLRLTFTIACEDVLGLLYRLDESQPANGVSSGDLVHSVRGHAGWVTRLAVAYLRRTAQLAYSDGGYHLTDAGRQHATHLVRSHRLWESYMARHFVLPEDHFDATASRLEHYIGTDLQTELAAELDSPQTDPHGKDIPR